MIYPIGVRSVINTRKRTLFSCDLWVGPRREKKKQQKKKQLLILFSVAYDKKDVHHAYPSSVISLYLFLCGWFICFIWSLRQYFSSSFCFFSIRKVSFKLLSSYSNAVMKIYLKIQKAQTILFFEFLNV